jgi:Transposase DDE domain group 1
MEVTEAVTVVHGDRGPGRIVVRADDARLTPFAGLVCVGELARRSGLVALVDAELASERRAVPVKRRRRGVSGGELVVSLAESQLVGGDCFDDIEELRADAAGAGLRAVARVPAAATALQLAKRFRRCLCQAVERGLARAGERLDRALGRDPGEPVTIDLDATVLEVYGRSKQGVSRNRRGQLSFAPHIAFWAQRGRALTGELVAGNREKLPARAAAVICRRALRLLPAGHGPVTFRIDSAYYAIELLRALRAKAARFSVSVPRTTAMWKALEQIPDDAWQPAIEMDGAEVAETSYTPEGWKHEPLRPIVRRRCFAAREVSKSPHARRLKTIHPEQLQLALAGQLASVYGYSFILTDIDDQSAAAVEHFHRHRAQIEERLKDAKLGQALRRLPSADINANRAWMTAVISALNLSAMLCDLSPLAGASGTAPEKTPLRRHAKTLRRALLCVPARITRHARKPILRFAAGYRHLDAFEATWAAAYALPPP